MTDVPNILSLLKKKKWKDVNLECMSEESSGDETEMGNIVVHHPRWRSRGIQCFVLFNVI